MKDSEALRILIQHAASNCAGCGTGIRSLPNKKEQNRVSIAIRRFWKRAHGQKMRDADWYNLTLSPPERGGPR